MPRFETLLPRPAVARVVRPVDPLDALEGHLLAARAVQQNLARPYLASDELTLMPRTTVVGGVSSLRVGASDVRLRRAPEHHVLGASPLEPAFPRAVARLGAERRHLNGIPSELRRRLVVEALAELIEIGSFAKLHHIVILPRVGVDVKEYFERTTPPP